MTASMPPLAMLFVIVLCLSGRTTAATNDLSDSIIAERTDKAVAHAVSQYDPDGPGASYIIAKDGVILAAGGIGYADLEWKNKNSDKTVFRLGSISKSITAVAVLELVETGQIDLDETISTYAPELPDQMGSVTMRQLLSHRSGLSDHVFDPDLLPLVWQPVTTEQMVEFQKDKPPEFSPGEKYSYVNFNYLLVAHILEKITNQPFVKFINQRFAAWDMPNTHYDWHDAIIPNRAEFYDQRDGVILNAQDVDLTHVSAAGALMSSAQDLAHWITKLNNDELINRESLIEAWTPSALPDGAPTTYGLGFNVTELAGEQLIWHTGLTPGSQAAFDFAPEKGIFVALLSNGFYLPNTGRLVDEMMMIMLTGDVEE